MICLEPRHELGFWLGTGNPDPQNTKGTKVSIRETRWGSTVTHAVAVDGEVLGWAVEHRSANGKTIGWGVWGDRGPDGLFPSRDEAAQWIAEHL